MVFSLCYSYSNIHSAVLYCSRLHKIYQSPLVSYCFSTVLYHVSLSYSCRAIDIPFYVGTIAPFVMIYVFNWAMFIVIMITFCRRTFREDMTIKEWKGQLIRAMILTILFGLGWGVGLFATQQLHQTPAVRDVISAIFIILTSFQGLYIFVIDCLRSKDVRNEWKCCVKIVLTHMMTKYCGSYQFDAPNFNQVPGLEEGCTYHNCYYQ